jgi:hypothetical protein
VKLRWDGKIQLSCHFVWFVTRNLRNTLITSNNISINNKWQPNLLGGDTRDQHWQSSDFGEPRIKLNRNVFWVIGHHKVSNMCKSHDSVSLLVAYCLWAIKFRYLASIIASMSGGFCDSKTFANRVLSERALGPFWNKCSTSHFLERWR